MTTGRALEPAPSPSEHLARLKLKFKQAQAELQEAEATLAAEQAAVNAFRMHCRLQLGDWVETLLEKRAERQALLTRIRLTQQAHAAGHDFDQAAWFESGTYDDEFASLPPDEGYGPAFDAGFELPITDTPNDRKAEKRLYRELARKFHPDLAENGVQRAYCTSMMAAVNEAYAQHDIQALRNLAGEIDPETAEELSQNHYNSREFQKLRKKIRGCQKRHRKIVGEVKALRQEGTAKLWRHAQNIDPNEGNNWWDEVAATLKSEIKRNETAIAELHRQLYQLNWTPTEPETADTSSADSI